MKRSLLLGGLAAVLVAVPALIAASPDGPIAVQKGAKDTPKFKGGSGKTVPKGALEIVQAGKGSSRTLAKKEGTGKRDLDQDLGRVIEDVDGMVISGPAELVAQGGVSYFVPEGGSAKVTVGSDGSITFEPQQGNVYSKSGDVTVMVKLGGSITSTPGGKFTGVTGEGEAGREGEPWVSFSGEGIMRSLNQAFGQTFVYGQVPGTDGPVSGSQGFR